MNPRAILCGGDGKFFGRAVMTLATAGLFDDADLCIYGWPAASIAHLPARIRFINIVRVMRDFNWSLRNGNFHPYLLRCPVIAHLMSQGYQQVLALDSDCLVCGDLADLWSTAAQNGIAGCRNCSATVAVPLELHGQFGAGLPARLALGGPELREIVLRLIGLSPSDCAGWSYMNAGVAAWNHEPKVLELLHEFVRLSTMQHDVVCRLRWPDQDLLNFLGAKYGIHAGLLDPERYNFGPECGADKRIIHWAGQAWGRISHLWEPFQPLIDRALKNLGTTFETVNKCFPVERANAHIVPSRFPARLDPTTLLMRRLTRNPSNA